MQGCGPRALQELIFFLYFEVSVAEVFTNEQNSYFFSNLFLIFFIDDLSFLLSFFLVIIITKKLIACCHKSNNENVFASCFKCMFVIDYSTTNRPCLVNRAFWVIFCEFLAWLQTWILRVCVSPFDTVPPPFLDPRDP